MNFNELKRHCATMQISVAKVAEEVGLSYDGLKKGLINGSLAMRQILPLCQSICITPNQFFGVDGNISHKQVQNGGVGNVQSMDAGTAILQEQLRIKDEQINKLLNIISK